VLEQTNLRTEPHDAQGAPEVGAIRAAIEHLKAGFGDDHGGVSTIAGIAVLTVGVMVAAALVVDTMMSHAEAVPEPGEVLESGE